MVRQCVHCKSTNTMVHFKNRKFKVDHAGLSTTVKGLSGWRCRHCGEIEFDPNSAQQYAAAGDDLVLRTRKQQSAELRRVRRKLGLSQVAAARLTGGGHNAFSRYERGEAVPLSATTNLFRLLDKHPDLLEELMQPELSVRQAALKWPNPLGRI